MKLKEALAVEIKCS